MSVGWHKLGGLSAADALHEILWGTRDVTARVVTGRDFVKRFQIERPT